MSNGRNLTIWNTKLFALVNILFQIDPLRHPCRQIRDISRCFWLSRPSSWFPSDTRHLCLPVHSIHRGFCSGTVDGSPQHSRTAWPQQFLWWWNRDLPVLVPKRQRGKKKRKKSQITGQVITKWKTWIYEQSKANPHPAQTDGSKSVWDRFLKTAKWSLPVFFLLKKKKNLKLIRIFDDMTINVVFSHSCVKSFEKWLDSNLAWPQN